MVTVGYGDISSQNDAETCLSIIAIIFGCMFFAYAINSIGNLVGEDNRRLRVLRYNFSCKKNKIEISNFFLILNVFVFCYFFFIFFK